MTTRTITPEQLAELKADREAADRRYNEALTRLNAALPSAPETWPADPTAPDNRLGPTLNERWAVLEDHATPGGWKGWIIRSIRRAVEPLFQRQQAFNAALVEHLNNNVPAADRSHAALVETLARLRRHLDGLTYFHFRHALTAFVQEITPYVDTKDYEFDGLARRRIEDTHELIGAVGGVGDELQKRLEWLGARERRFEARVASVHAAHDDLRASLAVLRRAHEALAHDVDRLARVAGEGGPRDVHAPAPAVSSDRGAGGERRPAISHAQLAGRRQDAYKYVAFEDKFRGQSEEIRGRLTAYLPLFDGARDVLDIGCGRGELLDLLRERGITARGLDINPEMVRICRERGLQVDQGEALTFLGGLPDESLGGLVAAQVVEHLQPDDLVQILATAHAKLRPGSRVVLETVNVACWFAFFQSYVRDVTHVRPLHPDTLSYFVRASGFQQVEVRFSSPLPDDHRLQHAPGDDDLDFAFNRNVDKLNSLLFTYLDYAVVAKKV